MVPHCILTVNMKIKNKCMSKQNIEIMSTIIMNILRSLLLRKSLVSLFLHKTVATYTTEHSRRGSKAKHRLQRHINSSVVNNIYYIASEKARFTKRAVANK